MSGKDATKLSYEQLVGALRKTRPDLHVRAAVELLIGHDRWLRRLDLVGACVRFDPAYGDAWIYWSAAREFFAGGPTGTSTELGVLDLAIALGEDRFRFNHLDSTDRQLIAIAVERALGLPPTVEGGRP